MRSRRRLPALPLLVCLLAGCSVGNYTYAEAAKEFDGIARIEGSPPNQRLRYLQHAEVLPWYSRVWSPLAMKPVFSLLFGRDLQPAELENPSGRARDLLTVLSEEVDDDLPEQADAVIRFAQVSELDASAINRITALNGLEGIACSMGLDLLATAAEAEGQPATPAHEADWIQSLKDLRPVVRGNLASFDAAARQRYLEALAGLSQHPLPQPTQRIALVRDLLDCWRSETEPELRQVTADHLRRATCHCIRWTILRALQRTDIEYASNTERLAEVRLAALDIVHRAGGADGVPFLLAWMEAPPARVRDGVPRFELDPLVRLRLVHLCGQLDLRRADLGLSLPGRQTAGAPTAIDYLGVVLLDPDSNMFDMLRIPALEALCHTLGRPFDLDDAWVRPWFEEHRRKS